MHIKGSVALTLSIDTGRPTKVQPIAGQNSGLKSHHSHPVLLTELTPFSCTCFYCRVQKHCSDIR